MHEVTYTFKPIYNSTIGRVNPLYNNTIGTVTPLYNNTIGTVTPLYNSTIGFTTMCCCNQCVLYRDQWSSSQLWAVVYTESDVASSDFVKRLH